MGNVSASLQRKLGPFPVWVWAIIGGVLLYLIRARTGGGGGGSNSIAATQAEAQLVQAEGQAAAVNMGTPLPLASGERVYDPNTGALLGQAPNTALEVGLLGILTSLLVPNQHHRDQKAPAHHAHKRKQRIAGVQHSVHPGTIMAPHGGAHKPKPPSGYHTVGRGHGRWMFVLNKKHPHSTQPGKENEASG